MTEKDKLYADELRKRALADYERLDHAINELERQTCDTPRNNLAESSQDCISREATIDVVRKWFDKIQLNGDICLDGIISLPSVTPSIPDVENNFNLGYNCGYADAMNDISNEEG